MDAAPSVPLRCVAVAYSGGRDSTALLHATLAAAAEVGVTVVALHVHHGLLPSADAWLAHCAAQCASWREAGAPVSFCSERLPPAAAHAGGTEAWARTLRYAALARMATAASASLLLLAHHRQDQSETVVLQALRGGGGVDGWSAMPQAQQRGGIVWARPWLDRLRADIDAYLAEHGIHWIDDDSNGDRRHARNRLRLDVWPALTAAFPQAESSLAAAARRAQDAAACLRELAAIDLAAVCPDGIAGGIALQRWCALSAPRRRNVLRAWLRQVTGAAPSSTLLDRLSFELLASSSGAVAWVLPGPPGSLRLWRGRLCWVPGLPGAAVEPPWPDAVLASVAVPGRHSVPDWSGWLRTTIVAERGVATRRLAQLRLRPRTGGERFQLGPGRPARSLKRQFQALGVPAWQRTGPLVYDSDGALLYVPGLGIDARAMAAPGEPQALLAWEAADASDDA